MTDSLTPEHRSRNMAAIKSTNTRPEMLVRRYLHGLGFRYQLHHANLPGKPDLFLKKYHTAIFIHGCFWHRHEHCKYAYTPKSNLEFWQTKFQKNIENDARKQALLLEAGINVVVIWECEIKNGSFKHWIVDVLQENSGVTHDRGS